jgi:uncharacterized membrane protein
MKSTKIVPLLAVGLLLFAGCQDHVPPLAPDDAALAVAEDAGKGPQVQPPRVGGYTLELFDVEFPGEVVRNTYVLGMNDRGDIVGNVEVWMEDEGAWRGRGYLFSNGTFHLVHFPGSTHGGAVGINDRGEIAGTMRFTSENTGQRGFVMRGGEYTAFDVPGAARTFGYAINANGVVTGQWQDPAGSYHGYLMEDGVFTTFDVPGATGTHPMGINPQGDIVGHYFDPTRDPARKSRHWPFLRLADGTFVTDHEYPVGPIREMALWGINPRGDLVGWYRPVTAWSPYFGFVLDKQGTYTKIEIPGTWETIPFAINASGVIAGTAYYWTIGTPFETLVTRGWIGYPVRGGGK